MTQPAAFSRAPALLRSRLAPHLLLLMVIVIWSVNAVVVKVGVSHVRPVPFTAARFLVGGVLLLAVARGRGYDVRRVPRLRMLAPAAILGIVINQLAFTYGVHLTTAVDVSLVMGLSPIAAAILVMLVSRRRLSPRTLVAIALGFAGVVLVVMETARGQGQGSLAGDLITLGAPLSWAGYLVLVAGESKRVPTTLATPWTILVAVAVLVPLALWQLPAGGDDWVGGLPALLYASVLATAVAYTAYFWALSKLGVTATAIYTYLQPAIGAAAGAILLHEHFTPWQALGAVAILGAAYLGSWRRQVPNTRPEPGARTPAAPAPRGQAAHPASAREASG